MTRASYFIKPSYVGGGGGRIAFERFDPERPEHWDETKNRYVPLPHGQIDRLCWGKHMTVGSVKCRHCEGDGQIQYDAGYTDAVGVCACSHCGGTGYRK